MKLRLGRGLYWFLFHNYRNKLFGSGLTPRLGVINSPFVVVVVVTQTLPRYGAMAEDHGAPEAGQLTTAWTRGRKETESRQRESGAMSPLLDSAE